MAASEITGTIQKNIWDNFFINTPNGNYEINDMQAYRHQLNNDAIGLTATAIADDWVNLPYLLTYGMSAVPYTPPPALYTPPLRGLVFKLESVTNPDGSSNWYFLRKI